MEKKRNQEKLIKDENSLKHVKLERISYRSYHMHKDDSFKKFEEQNNIVFKPVQGVEPNEKPNLYENLPPNSIPMEKLDSEYNACDTVKVLLNPPDMYKLVGSNNLHSYNHLNVYDLEAIIHLAKLGIYPVFTDICITYAEYEPLIIDNILKTFKAENREFVGLDTESYSSDNGKHNLALLQIALSETVVLIIFTKHLNSITLRSHAPKLLSFLQNSKVVKAGIGVNGDANRINKYFKLERPVVGYEISRDFCDNNPLDKTLESMSFFVLNIVVDKCKRKKYWNEVISIPSYSLKYAALDARLSYLLYMNMHKQKLDNTLRKIEEYEKPRAANPHLLSHEPDEKLNTEERSINIKHALRKLNLAYYSIFK